MEWLFGAVAGAVADLLGRTIFRLLGRSDRKGDVLRHDRQIFGEMDSIFSEEDIETMCNGELYNGQLSERVGDNAVRLLRYLEQESSRFITGGLRKRQDELSRKLAQVVEFTQLHFFRAELWEGWLLYPELKRLPSRQTEYHQYLLEIQENSGELWEEYLRFRKVVRGKLLV